MNSSIIWEIKSFEKLTNIELYDLLQLRNEVFVVGQDCVYQDADGFDRQAFHLSGYHKEKLIAYSRIFNAGIMEPQFCNFGRVAVASNYRRKGIGKELVIRTQAFLKERWPAESTLIHAQNYLRSFYDSMGFLAQGDVYDEVGIPHIKMIWQHCG